MITEVNDSKNRRKDKILFIDHDKGYTGSTVSLIYLVKYFIGKGFNVTILTNKCGTNRERYNKIGAIVVEAKFNMHLGVHFSSPDRILSLRGLYSFIITAYRFISSFLRSLHIIPKINPSVIYVNEYVAFPVGLAGNILKKDVVYHVRSQMIRGYLGIRRKIIQYILTHTSKKIIAITEQEALQFYNYKKYNGRKIFVVNEFLDDDDFHIEDYNKILKAKYNIPQDKFILLTLGGFKSLKDTLDILKALSILVNKDKSFCLIVVGKDDSDLQNKRSYLNKCLRYIAEQKLQPYLKTFGITENMGDFINVCDILINASTDSHFSRPVIEAWAKKKAVISSRVRHIEEYVEEDVNGLLYEPGNFEELSQKIHLLKNDEELAKRLGESGFRKAKELFNTNKNCERILNIINE